MKYKKLFTTLGLGLIAVTSLGYTGFTAEASSDFRHTVRSEGFIGPANGDHFVPNTLVQVTVPTVTSWLATEATNGVIEAPDFVITNDSPQANLEVTFISYTQSNDAALRGDLNLNLTGDLREGTIGQDITNTPSNTTPFTERLLSPAGVNDPNTIGRSEWRFSFEGAYTGAIPVNTLQPHFDLELAFSIDSYTTTPN